jgi:hypothetical protein
MSKLFPMTGFRSSPGITLAEYAIVLSLVGILGLLALKGLGRSTSGLLMGSSNTLANNSTLSLVQPDGGKGGSSESSSAANNTPIAFKGTGYYTVGFDPTTHQPTIQLADTATATNVTSVDGNQLTTYGTMLLATRLDRLATAQSDPAISSYYASLAKVAYYLGGAEGELDDVPALDLDVNKYTNANALQDVLAYKEKLQAMLQNPPKGIDSKEFMDVMPLAVDTYNIAQNYANTLSRFVKADGTVQDFGVADVGNSGSGTAGSSLRYVDNLVVLNADGLIPVPTDSYDDLVKLTKLKKAAQQIVAGVVSSTEPVYTTMKDATGISR